MTRYEIQDLTGYDPRRSRNGGAYAFYEEFEIKGGQPTNGRHATSAEADYCPFCGSFEQHMNEHVKRVCYERHYCPSPLAEKAAIMISQGRSLEYVDRCLGTGIRFRAMKQ